MPKKKLIPPLTEEERKEQIRQINEVFQGENLTMYVLTDNYSEQVKEVMSDLFEGLKKVIK